MWDTVLDRLDYPKRTYTGTWRRSKLFTERPHFSCAGDSTNQCTNMHAATAVRSLDSKPIKPMFKQYCVHASHPMRAGVFFSTPAQQALHQHLASSLLRQKDRHESTHSTLLHTAATAQDSDTASKCQEGERRAECVCVSALCKVCT